MKKPPTIKLLLKTLYKIFQTFYGGIFIYGQKRLYTHATFLIQPCLYRVLFVLYQVFMLSNNYVHDFFTKQKLTCLASFYSFRLYFKNLKFLFSTVLNFFTKNVAQFFSLHFFNLTIKINSTFNKIYHIIYRGIDYLAFSSKTILHYFSVQFSFHSKLSFQNNLIFILSSLINTPFSLFIFSILYTLFWNKSIAYCEWTDWNPGKYLLSDPIENKINDVDNQGTVSYPKLIVDVASLLKYTPPLDQIEDGNSTSDASSESDNSSQNNDDIVFANVLLKDYHDTVLQQCNTREDIVEKSLIYVKAIIPNELFAASLEEVKDEFSSINVYLDQIKKTAILETETDAITLANFVTAVTTYNVACLHHITYESHKVIIENVYFATLNNFI